jgi:hypothetical protein
MAAVLDVQNGKVSHHAGEILRRFLTSRFEPDERLQGRDHGLGHFFFAVTCGHAPEDHLGVPGYH